MISLAISNDIEMKNKILEARARFPFNIGLSAFGKGQRTRFTSVELCLHRRSSLHARVVKRVFNFCC